MDAANTELSDAGSQTGVRGDGQPVAAMAVDADSATGDLAALEFARTLWRAAEVLEQVIESRVAASEPLESSSGIVIEAIAGRVADEGASAASVAAALRTEACGVAEAWYDSAMQGPGNETATSAPRDVPTPPDFRPTLEIWL